MAKRRAQTSVEPTREVLEELLEKYRYSDLHYMERSSRATANEHRIRAQLARMDGDEDRAALYADLAAGFEIHAKDYKRMCTDMKQRQRQGERASSLMSRSLSS
jgi:hypothetical protein